MRLKKASQKNRRGGMVNMDEIKCQFCGKTIPEKRYKAHGIEWLKHLNSSAIVSAGAILRRSRERRENTNSIWS